jgi:hypothetical protein
MLAKLSLLIGSVVFTLLALEALLARFAPQRTVDYVRTNRAAVYRPGEAQFAELIPNFTGRLRAHEGEYDTAIRINSLGYRQAEFTAKKGAQMRLVAIGDSFTFGHGVESEEAWPHVLERELAAPASRPVEVINAGVNARWVDEYYLELKLRTLALDPDVVIVGFFIGNDIDAEDAHIHVWRQVDARGRPLRIDIPDQVVQDGFVVHREPELRWRFPVLRNSHAAQLLFGAWRGISELWSPRQPGEAAMYEPVYTADTEQIVARVQDLLVAMAELCRLHGARFLVVMIPTRQQVNPELRRGPSWRDWEKPQRVVAAFFAQSGISFIDLLPVLRAASAEAPVYFRFDAHWTARGHGVAARAIAEHLWRNGFLTGTPVTAAMPPTG